MYALELQGFKCPQNKNVRKTQEFKAESSGSSQSSGRSRQQKRKPSAQHGKPNGRNRLRRKAHNNSFAQSVLGTDLHIDLISSPLRSSCQRVTPWRAEIPGSELGTRNRGISKQIYWAFARLEMMNRIDN